MKPIEVWERGSGRVVGHQRATDRGRVNRSDRSGLNESLLSFPARHLKVTKDSSNLGAI